MVLGKLRPNARNILSTIALSLFLFSGFLVVFPRVFPSLIYPAVIFFDVGQGDASLVITRYKRTILIDGGPDAGILYKLGRYLPWWERKIDIMVLSHPHTDHLIGLNEVLERYQVGEIYATGVFYNSPAYEAFFQLAREKRIPLRFLPIDEEVFVDDDTRLRFLFPTSSIRGVSIENINNSSIVIEIAVGETSLLFFGDAEKEVQEKLLSLLLDSGIVKIPHHGSSDALHPEFWKSLSPQYAVISVGENRFGHPSRRTLRTLERIGAVVLTTQEEGDIVFQLDHLIFLPFSANMDILPREH